MSKIVSQSAYYSLMKPPMKVQTKKSEKLPRVSKEEILKQFSISSKKVNQSIAYSCCNSSAKGNRSKSKSSKHTYNQCQMKLDFRIAVSKIVEISKKRITNPIKNSKVIVNENLIGVNDNFTISASSGTKIKKSIKFCSDTKNTLLSEQNASKCDPNFADGSSNETMKQRNKSSLSLHTTSEIKPLVDQIKDKPFSSEKKIEASRKFSILDIVGTNSSQNLAKLNIVAKQPSKQSILNNFSNPRIKCLFLLSINK